jgi:hypothetical protein
LEGTLGGDPGQFGIADLGQRLRGGVVDLSEDIEGGAASTAG